MNDVDTRSVAATQPIGAGAWRMLVAFVRAYPGRSALALAALLVAGLLDGLGLSTLLSMLSLATGDGESPSLPEELALEFAGALGITPTAGTMLLLAIALIGTKAILVLLANRQVGYTVAHVATDLRLALLRAVMASRWRYYLAQPVGRLSNAVATEAQRASEGFRHGAVMGAQLLNAMIYAVVALAISWQASLAALVAGGVLLAGLNVLVRMAGRAGRSQTGLLKSLLGVMTDQLGAVKPLKAMGREEHVDALLARQIRGLNIALRRQVFSKEALTALQEPLLAILVGVGFFVFVVSLDMPLAAVVVMLFLLARVVNFLAKAQRAWQHIVVAESAYWSLRETIHAAEAEREPARGHRAPTLDEGIELRDVTFGHGAQPLLVEQSMRIPAGALTVIVGPSGAGKTTLVDLVAGLLRPDRGEVLVDGVPLADIDHRQWRHMIGYVPQDPLLVNDTVLHNVTLGQSELGEDDVREALELANAWDFASALPDGVHTLLGERGGRLSGGQRQRLALARALVHRPRLLVLDEVTSSLDAAAEAAVIDTIVALKGRLTMLGVTHGNALRAAADHVYRMHEGVVSANGADNERADDDAR